MPVFVGERYIPQAQQEVALAQVEQLRLAVQRLAGEGWPVQLLSTTFVPNEEWVFDLFEAESGDQVRRVYDESSVPVERVTKGVHLPGPSQPTDPS
jgi:hypothetical protein